MRYRVLRYEPHPNDFHVCENLDDPDNSPDLIDLRVGSKFPNELKNEDLVGKIVEFEDMHTYVYIANNAIIVDEK